MTKLTREQVEMLAVCIRSQGGEGYRGVSGPSLQDWIDTDAALRAEKRYHTDCINRLAKYIGQLGETSVMVVDTAIAELASLRAEIERLNERVKQDQGLVGKLNDLTAQLAAVTKERDELLTELDAVLCEEPLPSGQYVHRLVCSGDKFKPAGSKGVSCSCRVGRARYAHIEQQLAASHAKLAEYQKEGMF